MFFIYIFKIQNLNQVIRTSQGLDPSIDSQHCVFVFPSSWTRRRSLNKFPMNFHSSIYQVDWMSRGDLGKGGTIVVLGLTSERFMRTTRWKHESDLRDRVRERQREMFLFSWRFKAGNICAINIWSGFAGSSLSSFVCLHLSKDLLRFPLYFQQQHYKCNQSSFST